MGAKGNPTVLEDTYVGNVLWFMLQNSKIAVWMDSKTCSARVQDPSTTSAWSYLANLNLADASVQLASIDLQIRERLYAEYCAQCADLAPYLHQRGRR